MGAGHGHGHAASHASGRAADRSGLRLVLAITAVVLVVELVGAYLASSLALLADAGHVATDAAGVLLALGASYVASRPGGPRSTFGYHRAEILAAMANAVVLLVVCVYIAWAGFARLRHPGDVEVEAGLLIAFACVGLLANAASLRVLRRSGSQSLNMRGAMLEVAADLVGSVLAITAGVVIAVSGWVQADAVASLLIAALILPRAWSLLKESAAVLLEIAPAGLDLGAVEAHIAGMPGVVEVHDLHAWTITSGIPSLSAHVTVTDAALAEAGVGGILDRLCDCVAQHFGVQHATFQVEPLSHRDHEDLGDLHA
ncbi:cation transporter [Nocardioides agariphilus]|uniref:Cation transporter n=1 Tax=Nocardioides agariphilus TaxID=433664 RepID=A0A930VNW6_9ACTN|nr:cation transporter [Nocardioides agariphilus]